MCCINKNDLKVDGPCPLPLFIHLWFISASDKALLNIFLSPLYTSCFKAILTITITMIIKHIIVPEFIRKLELIFLDYKYRANYMEVLDGCININKT